VKSGRKSCAASSAVRIVLTSASTAPGSRTSATRYSGTAMAFSVPRRRKGRASARTPGPCLRSVGCTVSSRLPAHRALGSLLLAATEGLDDAVTGDSGRGDRGEDRDADRHDAPCELCDTLQHSDLLVARFHRRRHALDRETKRPEGQSPGALKTRLGQSCLSHSLARRARFVQSRDPASVTRSECRRLGEFTNRLYFNEFAGVRTLQTVRTSALDVGAHPSADSKPSHVGKQRNRALLTSATSESWRNTVSPAFDLPYSDAACGEFLQLAA
jgi:hypothetical protein